MACIAGTRIPVSMILDDLAADVPVRNLVDEYPTLSEEAVRATLVYAVELVSRR